MKRNSHCSYCGHAFDENRPWPRRCTHCRKSSFLNPIPVVVVLLPVDGGLVVIRRGIEPAKGKWALPGGFIDWGESWQEAAVRELWEETLISIPVEEIQNFDVCSAKEGLLLIFALAQPRTTQELPPFYPTDETTDRAVLRSVQELAFPLHTKAVQDFFQSAGAVSRPTIPTF